MLKTTKQLPAAPRAVYWLGTPPTICDLCQRPLADTFIDGAVKPQGSWGNLDLACHRKFGVGLGTGKGQMYKRQADGRWLKTEG
jgi:hypothetical protein